MRITRTDHIDFIDEEYVLFVTIRIFIEMDLKNEKGNVPPPPEPAEGHSHLHFIV